MKKMLAMVLCLVLAIISVGCSTGSNSIQNDNSSELSPKEKYDNAVSLMNDKKYDEAIGIFEQIDYEDSKELKKTASYIYACELFNEKNFESAYNYFERAEDYSDSKKNMNRSAYYAGVKLVNAEMHWKSIGWFRRVLDDQEFKSAAEKHIVEITTDLLGANWIGSFTSKHGSTLQVELKYYRSKDNLYIGHADRSNGYRLIDSLSGSLNVGAKTCRYYHSETTFGGTWDAVEFSFTASDRMYVSCDASSIGEAISGFYTAKSAAFSTYEIELTGFPMLTVPTMNVDTNGVDAAVSSNIANASSKLSSEIVDTSNVVKTSSNKTKPSNSNSSKVNNVGNSTSSKTASKNAHTHSYSKATCTKPATCSCGVTTGSALGHSWKNATCKTPKTCNNCGTTEGSKLNHSYKNEKCTMCGEKSANYPKASDIKIEYPSQLVYESVFEVRSYSISNMDGYFDGKAKVAIKMEIVDIRRNNDHSEYFGVKYYDANGNDITRYKPYDSQYISSGSVMWHLDTGDVCTSEFEIPANCRKIVLISIR